MKKIITFSFALMASATMFGQTVLWNGENYDISSKGDFWDRCNQEVVENPSKDGINTSDKCLKFTITGNYWNNGSAAKGLICDAFDSKRLSLMIKKDVNSNVRVEIRCNADDPKKVAAWYDGAGEWRKLYFDFSTNNAEGNPTEITIYPTTDNVDGEQVVYIDNIQIEDAPKVGDALLESISDGSLDGNIKLTGAWLKGECQNADGVEWQKVEYNDFATLAGKLKDGITSINMRGTTTKDVDVNAMRGEHSNVLVFANEAYDANNIVANEKCANLVLTNAQPFATPEDFTAASVSITRPVFAGKNTMCLPFWVSKEDLGANTIATYVDNEVKDGNTIINFEKKDAVVANVPFIAQFDADSNEPLTFTDKGVVNTPTEMGSPFTGTYTPGSAADKYGLNAEGLFQKGGETAKINAFSAYLTLTEAQEAKPILLAIGTETTGINAATVANGNETIKVYNLQGRLVATAKSLNDLHLASGVYIVNNKKVIVK